MSNREILFRGKRVDTKEWIEGYFVIDGAGRNLFAVPNDGAPVVTFYPVISATVGQFTGLTDKNGKKIFEGDIVKFDDTGEEGYEYKEGFDFVNVARVEFYKGRFQLTDFLSDNSGVLDEMNSCHDDFADMFGCYVEVIGNIHDGPELSGGEKS